MCDHSLKWIRYPPQLNHCRKNGKACIKYFCSSTWAWKHAHTYYLHKRVLFWRRSCQLALPTRLIYYSVTSTAVAHRCMHESKYILRHESFQRVFTLFWITPHHFSEHKSWWVTLERVPSAWAWCAKTGIKASRFVGSWWHTDGYRILTALF